MELARALWKRRLRRRILYDALAAQLLALGFNRFIVMDDVQRYGVWCDNEQIGYVRLAIADADSAQGELEPVPGFEPVRSVLVRYERANLAVSKHIAEAQREGRLPGVADLSVSGENHLTTFELPQAELERIGREVFDAIAAGQALRFELRDGVGHQVPGVDVEVYLNEHPDGPQGVVPPMVVVWSGRWRPTEDSPDADGPTSRPEA